jgi:hypothetical protein
MFHINVALLGISLSLCAIVTTGCGDNRQELLHPDATVVADGGVDGLAPTSEDASVDTTVPDTSYDTSVPSPPAFTPGPLKLYTVKSAIKRNAVCNDGSPAKYYARLGSGTHASKWIIHLKGGASCWKESGCADRWISDPQLMSSKSFAQTKTGTGIFSQDAQRNPDFYNWNHVYLNYCSSDKWAGDQGASPETYNWHFRGKAIVKAVMKDLMKFDTTQNLASATEVLLTGSSAGGSGVKFNLDLLATSLPQASVKGVLDSSYGGGIEDVLPPNPVKDDWVLQGQVAIWNPEPDASCMAALNDQASCIDPNVIFSHISTPYFVFVDQHDVLATGKYNGDATLIAAHAENVRQALQALPGAFSTRKSFHTALMKSPRFFGENVQKVNYATVLGNWYFSRPGPTNVIKP